MSSSGLDWNRAPALFSAAALCFAASVGAAAPLPEIATAQAVRALSAEEAAKGYPVRIRGVATFFHDGQRRGYIQDDSGGIYADLNPEELSPETGDYVELRGVVSPCGFAPCVRKGTVVKLGRGPVPKPIRPTFGQLYAGSLTSQWSQVEGMVRAGRIEQDRLHLLIDADGRQVPVIVQGHPEDWNARWIGARVRVQGVLSAIFKNTRQVIGAHIHTPDARYVQVLSSPASNPFEIPLTPLSELGTFLLDADLSDRLRTRGVVTAIGPGDTLYLFDDGRAARVDAWQRSGAEVGDLVDVVGFYDIADGRPSLQQAVVRVVGRQDPPAPVAATPADLLRNRSTTLGVGAEFDMMPVRLVGRVIRTSSNEPDHSMVVESEGYAFTVRLPHEDEIQALGIQTGSVISVSGLCLLASDLDESAFRILTRSAADIVELRSPPWWTRDHMLWALAALFAGAGAIALWGVSLRRQVAAQTGEILQRLESEAALESRYRRLFERNLAALLRLAADGRILECNAAGARLLGYDPGADISGASIVEHCAYPEYTCVLLKPKADLGPQEVCLKRKDGATVWTLAGVAQSEEDPSAGPVSEITLLDITRQRESEEQILEAKAAAEAANQAKSEFLANMSHEIRTPLNGVLGMTRLALQGDLDSDAREYLGLAIYSAESLLTIVNDVLDFSKIEARKIELEEVSFDPREVFRKAFRTLEPKAKERGLGLTLEIDDAVPRHIAADPTRLRQVVLNLVSNAVKFTEEGEVSLKIHLDSDSKLLFEVADTGIGVPPDKRDLVFQPFQQADGCTTRRYGGTGLGLAVSARLVELMHGKIWLEDRPGGGSRFFFTARFGPATAAPPDPASLPGFALSSASGANKERPPLSVLVAEDNPVNRLLAVRLLERAGHHVHVVENGADAVRAATQQRFDVVLMDVQMPVMDGLQACRAIRRGETGHRTPILALTAHAMTGDEQRCLAAGMDGYLTKPLDPDKLYAAIDRFCAPAASQRRNALVDVVS